VRLKVIFVLSIVIIIEKQKNGKTYVYLYIINDIKAREI
jgi:hypothetical protein